MADIFYMPSVIISFADPIRMVLSRAVARHNNWGGGGIFIYSCSRSLKTIVFKRKTLGRTRIYEYAPPPPPIIGLAAALVLATGSVPTENLQHEVMRPEGETKNHCEGLKSIVFW